MSTDPRVDVYIASRAAFARPILTWLRERVHAACPDVVETIRWSMPSFTYRDTILVQMAAFKAHAAFSFWNREGMETGKERDAMGQFGRIESLADLPGEAAVEAMIREAAAKIAAGARPARPARAPKPEAEVPADLAEALAGDATARAVFDGFPPSCRREYCEWVGEAKRPETRAKRVADAVAWMREGKRRNWKYENC